MSKFIQVGNYGVVVPTHVVSSLPDGIVYQCLQKVQFSADVRDFIANVDSDVALLSPLIVTRRIGIDQPTWFAVRKSDGMVVRVGAKGQLGSMSKKVALQFCWRDQFEKFELVSACVGDSAPIEIFEKIKEKGLFPGFWCMSDTEFWIDHAHAHNPSLMDDPYTSSWRDVVAEYLGKNPASGHLRSIQRYR